MNDTKDLVIVIAGPTASGKTQASVQIAKNLRVKGIFAEIINADSMQIYNDLKILTAFPSKDEQECVPHHLFGILGAHEEISVVDWKNLVESKIDELHASNKIPILCGGTGFYIDTVIHGISDIPSVPETHRKKVYAMFLELGREKFFNKLSLLDAEICSKLHPNNTQRILRAYEVVSYTGKPLSYWWIQGVKAKYRNIVSVAIMPEREILAQQISERVEAMIRNHAVKEVADFLRNNPNYEGPLDAVIGFSEIRKFLTDSNNKQLSDLQKEICIRTRQYAKRQSTWFRNKMKEALFVRSPQQAVSAVIEIYNNRFSIS